MHIIFLTTHWLLILARKRCLLTQSNKFNLHFKLHRPALQTAQTCTSNCTDLHFKLHRPKVLHDYFKNSTGTCLAFITLPMVQHLGLPEEVRKLAGTDSHWVQLICQSQSQQTPAVCAHHNQTIWTSDTPYFFLRYENYFSLFNKICGKKFFLCLMHWKSKWKKERQKTIQRFCSHLST